MACVLLVSRDDRTGIEIADYLEGVVGHGVMWCPGPQAPGFICVGGRGARCPLAVDADVVVLDGWLASDAVRKGTPAWHLLRYYRERDLPVVFLVGPDGLQAPLRDTKVRTLPRSARPVQIEEAIASLIGAGASCNQKEQS